MSFSFASSHCSADKLGNKIDVRGDGGYIVAPPSIHISGVYYEFINDNRIQPLPPGIVERIAQTKSNSKSKNEINSSYENNNYENGSRNDSLARIAGKLRHAGLSQAEFEAALLKYQLGKMQTAVRSEGDFANRPFGCSLRCR